MPHDYQLMPALSTNHTWRVRARYANNPPGPLHGYEYIESLTTPQHGRSFASLWGKATIQSKRPRRVPCGMTRAELQYVYHD